MWTETAEPGRSEALGTPGEYQVSGVIGHGHSKRSESRLRTEGGNRWQYSLGLAVFMLLAILGPTRFLLAQNAPLPEPLPPFVLDQDYRGSRAPQAPVVLFGPNADRVSHPDEKGWRITLPAEHRPKPDAVGLVLTSPLQGNFEITVGYEILHADQPRSGNGVGIELYFLTETPTREALGFSRLVRVAKGEVYTWSRMTTNEDGKRISKNEVRPAPNNKSGRLRLTRKGTEATLWASEEDAGDFHELDRVNLGSEDLRMVRAAAYTGTAPYAVDLRIVDLKIRAEAMIKDQVADPPAPAPGAAAPGAAVPKAEKGSLAAAGIIGLVLLLSFFGFWLFLRRRRRPDEIAAEPSPTEPAAKPEAAREFVTFACSACSTHVKARAKIAGKKIKCPRCGQVISVPAIQADGHERIPS